MLGTDPRTIGKNADHIRSTTRGAQHENFFAQIIGHTNMECRVATLEEDLQGADFVLSGFSNTPLYVDVKASLFAVRNIDPYGSRPFAWRESRNDVTMVFYSGVNDQEANDRFVLPEEVAFEKASEYQSLIATATSAA